VLRDFFKKHMTSTNKKVLWNNINIANKLMYICLNNHCLYKGCSTCKFNVCGCCTLKSPPEEWQYKHRELKIAGHFLYYAYDPNLGKSHIDLPILANYCSAVSYWCYNNVYDCSFCKFKGANNTTSECKLSLGKLLNFK